MCGCQGLDYYEAIEKVSKIIYQTHCNFSEGYYEKHLKFYNESPNLKKFSLLDASTSDEFMYDFIPNYLDELKSNEAIYENLFKIPEEINFRFRPKSIDTVYKKVQHYVDKSRFSSQVHGTLFVSKSLNDLFGGRMIIPNINLKNDEIVEELESLKASKIVSRYYHRNDGFYKAYHCYFQKDNRYMPWELQIWDTLDEKQNYDEHVRHEAEREGVE
jgi:hypothetical protein